MEWRKNINARIKVGWQTKAVDVPITLVGGACRTGTGILTLTGNDANG